MRFRRADAPSLIRGAAQLLSQRKYARLRADAKGRVCHACFMKYAPCQRRAARAMRKRHAERADDAAAITLCRLPSLISSRLPMPPRRARASAADYAASVPQHMPRRHDSRQSVRDMPARVAMQRLRRHVILLMLPCMIFITPLFATACCRRYAVLTPRHTHIVDVRHAR